MSDDEFNREINQGALAHPLLTFQLSRALMCLRSIIESVPGAEDAFRRWCSGRDAQDRADDEDL